MDTTFAAITLFLSLLGLVLQLGVIVFAERGDGASNALVAQWAQYNATKMMLGYSAVGLVISPWFPLTALVFVLNVVETKFFLAYCKRVHAKLNPAN